MLVLASASPRRRDLLGQAGLRFEVRVAGVPEDLPEGIEPDVGARELARRKAAAVAEGIAESAFVIGADTVVALDEPAGPRLLGKPEGPEEARAMLESLSGTRHRVVTGVCVIRTPAGACEVASETTWVTMRPITPEEVSAYVASGEWEDKAGGYAIQENADAFVTRLEGGGFDNVVGLPVGLTLQLLGGLGAEDLPDPR